MLKLINIKKVYTSGSTEHTALQDVTLSFRKNEFVAVLGASGSGKTTLLNIIGGLDQYTSGDLIINGTSSKNFQSEDWDAYRNNSIGFIFQNYHLISHLSVRDNVEMGMKLSGVPIKERRKKAEEALAKVGLQDHINKYPNQLSGGQMQRVAIARAIVNDPEIILADEPTGALDSETSIQVMDIIKELSKEKLVIMVTHNAELASTYSTRIVRFKDGTLIEDTNPILEEETAQNYELKHTSMSFMTALKSSGKNVLSKKWRTILTSFASSVGIIGVALVLSISNGFSNQIDIFQTEMLSALPITITEGASIPMGPPDNKEIKTKSNRFPSSDKIYITPPRENELYDTHVNKLSKPYMDYVFQIDSSLINSFLISRTLELPILNQLNGKATKLNTFNISLTTYPYTDKKNLSSYLQQNYDLLAGAFPKEATDLVLLVNSYNQLETTAASELGLTNQSIDLTSLLNKEFKLVYNDSFYVQSGDIFKINGNPNDLSDLYNQPNNLTLKITGVIRVKENITATRLSSGLLYSDLLNELFIENAKNSAIVAAQKEVDYNILTGDPLLESDSLFSNIRLPDMFGSFSANLLTKELMLEKLGATSIPSSISIYPKTFEAKDSIISYLDAWNKDKTEEESIEYTDMAEIVGSSLNTFIKTISYVLIAFASISLIVSMIMIGIIIYVSVLERTKEIGILRALGARKKDITRLFNAETFIIGATSGIIGIVITYLLSIPINMVINNLTGYSTICTLNPIHAISLIVLSIILTMIGGFIPAKMAAKKDPVVALRSE